MNKVKYAILSTGLCLFDPDCQCSTPQLVSEPRPVEFLIFRKSVYASRLTQSLPGRLFGASNPSGNMQRLLPKVRRTIFRWRAAFRVNAGRPNGRFNPGKRAPSTSGRETIDAVARIFKVLGARYRIPSDIINTGEPQIRTAW